MASQHDSPRSDIEIAQHTELRPIEEIARNLGIDSENLSPHGRYKAKLPLHYVYSLKDRHVGKLILVTAITPTAAGEGKTTISIGLADGLNRIGKRAIVCLRQPSLGPCFGVKGGAAGGGYAQVLPMEEINLHFTGDFHAVGAAHNLLSALIDNHLHWGNRLGLDARRVAWRRALDINDRALRQIIVGLGGPGNGFPREEGFEIVPASEIMAILCLSESLTDLKHRLDRIVIGYTADRKPITSAHIEAAGALSALLRDALAPNLVQTIEHNPALIHGGPFGNIAHGCNTVMATKAGLGLADYVVTEAGFGSDLGAEKFVNIKCRSAGLRPDGAIIVATIRAIKMHGGGVIEEGFANLARHVENVRKLGLPVLVCINRFSGDTQAEQAAIIELCDGIEAECVTADPWAQGGRGAVELAQATVRMMESPVQLRMLYPDDMPLWTKASTIAREMYGAEDITADIAVRRKFDELQEAGYGSFPVCMAKTEFSFTTDKDRKGAPQNHIVRIRDVRLAAGAKFVVAICGEVMTMPGLPKAPAAGRIDITADGRITGLS